ncbi:GPI-anchored surface protein, putative, partial [Bodo saltans]
DGDVCSAAQWISGCTIGLGCVHAVLCVALRPFSVRLEFWAAVSADVLGVLSQILALAGSVDGASVAVTIAAIAELIVVVLMMLNFGTLSWQQGEAASHDEEEGTLRSVHRTTNKESIEMSAEWQARRLLQRSQDGVGARQSFATNHAVTYETPFNASEPLRVLIELVCTQRGSSLL